MTLKTLFYKEDHISKGEKGQRKRLVLTAEEAGVFLRKYDRDRWFLLEWMGDGDVPAIPKCLTRTVCCPGKAGNITTTTYLIEEVHHAGHTQKFWEGQTEFIGTLIQQVSRSSKYGATRYDEPFINSKAPDWLIEIGINQAREEWRMDFKSRFPITAHA